MKDIKTLPSCERPAGWAGAVSRFARSTVAGLRTGSIRTGSDTGVVFLIGLDDTLLCSDQVLSDLHGHIVRELGEEDAFRYWKIVAAMRDDPGYVDYLGALQQLRDAGGIARGDDQRILHISTFLVDYPFAARLYPHATDAIEWLSRLGTTVILSDGDAVLQLRKVHRSGLWDAVAGRVLIFVHKERMLDAVERRYPASRYVMIDDKPRILSAMKGIMGNRLMTILVRQGTHGRDSRAITDYPAADLTIDRIGELVDHPDLTRLTQSAGHSLATEMRRAERDACPVVQPGHPDRISSFAGTAAPRSSLVHVPSLVTAYFADIPDPEIPEQRVTFGTSGHRGTPLRRSFNEWHVLAIAQAICDHRRKQGITGPLYLGVDTHAVSHPALGTVLQVLAANSVEVMLATNDEYTPTPAISHAILVWNRGRTGGIADGIVVTPSHNPPEDGGLKYNPPHGGAAGTQVTDWIQSAANLILQNRLAGVRQMTHAHALRAPTTHRHNFLDAYVHDLGSVIDMDAVRASGVRMAVDPFGGAGVNFWGAIADRYGLDLTVMNDVVDPAFGFMPLDWDGRIRMDPSSRYAMRRVVAARGHFDIAFACDTDHDRHGIVVPGIGLLPANHILSIAVDYLLDERKRWPLNVAVGKTMISTRLIDRVAARRQRRLYEVPEGFKWFATRLQDGSLGFAGAECGAASFLRVDGTPWTTDSDGMVMALLTAEITARRGRHPGDLYRDLANTCGDPIADTSDVPATNEQKALLAGLSPNDVRARELAAEPIVRISVHAPGNGAALGGVKVDSESGWFAASASATKGVYKIHAESFIDHDHLMRIVEEAQSIVAATFSGSANRSMPPTSGDRLLSRY